MEGSPPDREVYRYPIGTSLGPILACGGGIAIFLYAMYLAPDQILHSVFIWSLIVFLLLVILVVLIAYPKYKVDFEKIETYVLGIHRSTIYWNDIVKIEKRRERSFSYYYKNRYFVSDVHNTSAARAALFGVGWIWFGEPLIQLSRLVERVNEMANVHKFELFLVDQEAADKAAAGTGQRRPASAVRVDRFISERASRKALRKW